MAQDELEELILTELAARGVPLLFDTEVVGLAAGTDEVRVRLSRPEGSAETRVDYLIGCDGARSRVRGWIGADMPDREVVGYPNTAFYRADLGDIVQRWQTHLCFVRNTQVFATIASFNGRDRWSSHIMDYPGKPDGPAELSPEHTLRLLHAALGDDTISIELLSVNAWEAALGLASAFRRDRVFLAGDAAHVQTSAGGLGMNTGIQDGHNLAWKLAAVLRGEAGDALLDTYETERRPAARASLTLSRDLSYGFADQDTDPARWYERIGVEYLRAMMFYRYRYRSPAILDDPSGEPAPDTEVPDVLTDEPRIGRRLPHLWLDAGHRHSTLDLVAPGWLLLTGPDATTWRKAAERVQGVDLRVHQLPDRRTTSDHGGRPPTAPYSYVPTVSSPGTPFTPGPQRPKPCTRRSRPSCALGTTRRAKSCRSGFPPAVPSEPDGVTARSAGEVERGSCRARHAARHGIHPVLPEGAGRRAAATASGGSALCSAPSRRTPRARPTFVRTRGALGAFVEPRLRWDSPPLTLVWPARTPHG